MLDVGSDDIPAGDIQLDGALLPLVLLGRVRRVEDGNGTVNLE